jgi:hypothetical protein
MRKIILQIITVIAYLLLSHTIGMACICENTKTPAQEFEAVEAVFSGKVVEMTEIETENGLDEGHLVKFSVEKSWKLIDQSEVIIFTAGVGMCGYPFDVGETYLVYAIREGRKELTTRTCRKTARLEYAKEELKDLEGREQLKISKKEDSQQKGKAL